MSLPLPPMGQRGRGHFEGGRGRLLARGRVHEVGKDLRLLQEEVESLRTVKGL